MYSLKVQTSLLKRFDKPRKESKKVKMDLVMATKEALIEAKVGQLLLSAFLLGRAREIYSMMSLEYTPLHISLYFNILAWVKVFVFQS